MPRFGGMLRLDRFKSTMSEYLEDLNPAQRDAVTHRDGPLMVLAGAGSGKTRVITRRIAWLLQEGVAPGQILALTFTNKAAGEMANRVESLRGYRVHVATFHSACARFLRRDGHLLGYPQNFSIYDTYDRDSCIKQLLRSHHIQVGGAVTPNKVGSRISRLKNLGVGPEDFVSGLGEVDAVVRRIYSPYLVRMRDLGAMDFDDLLLRFRDLLVEHPDAAEMYQERFRYLLVDEFQDTNLVQYDLLKRLSAKYRNLCVVGDPDQSIYKFRGAEIRNILDYQDDYPDAVTIRLETNYRSSGCILAAAQGVIENNKGRMDKTLRTDAEFGAPVSICRYGSEQEEAEELTNGIWQLMSNGIDLGEVAVFYRTHSLSRTIEQAFRQRGLPYDVVGGLTFFERREIKDVLAYLRVLVNPLDDVSMLRVINVPPRGVGNVSLQKIIDRAADAGLSLFEAVCDADCRGVVSGKARKGLESLAKVLTEARGEENPEEAVRIVLKGTEYLGYAGGLGDPQDASREENILELINDAAQFAEESDEGLAEYLQHVSLLTSQDEQHGEGPRISLMTVHSAKGLEFDYVFTIGLEEGLFPHSRSFEDPEGMEEERRLMYVAMTRARKALALSYVSFRMINGETRRQDMSRFLGEIPDECGTRMGMPWGYEADGDGDTVYEADDGIDYDPGDQLEDDTVQLCEGAYVVHPEYGPGQVLRLSGSGIRMKVVVLFQDGREKTLIPEYAGLQVIDGSEEW